MGSHGSKRPPDIHDDQKGEPATWDAWGYAPPGAKVAQKNYALSYSTATMGAWGGTKVPGYYGTSAGLAMDPGAFLGTDDGGIQVQALWSNHVTATFPGGVAGGKTIPKNFPKAVGWYDSQYCTPDTFPNCDMVTLSNDAPDYDLWNSKTAQFKSNAIGMSDVILKQTDAYAAGQLAYVDYINGGDTSTHIDPCDGPGVIDQLLPYIGAILIYKASEAYVTPALSDLGISSLAGQAINFNGALLGYHLGHQAGLPVGADQEDGFKAGVELSYTIGFVAGSVIVRQYPQYQDFELQAGLAGAALASQTIAPMLAYAMEGIVASGSLPIQIITSTWDYIAGLLCKWTKGVTSACDDFGSFPDARRWGTAEFAAKIVDELCQEEGWERESPQARFAMMALTTTPAWQMAASVDERPIKSNYDTHALNPTGQVVPVNWASRFVGGAGPLGGRTAYWQPVDISNPDGTAYATWEASANSDAIMCQNYDVIMQGNAKGNLADPMLAPRFAERILKWKEEVRANAWDPVNWNKAYNVPGMGLNWHHPPKYMSIPQYLANCVKSSADGGFDTMLERGRYAQMYTKQPKSVSDMDWMLVQINQFLDASPDVDTFYAALVAAKVSANLCGAISYMLRKPDEGAQQADWYEWRKTENPSVKACWDRTELIPPLQRARLTPTKPPGNFPPLRDPRIIPLVEEDLSSLCTKLTNQYIAGANDKLPDSQWQALKYYYNNDGQWITCVTPVAATRVRVYVRMIALMQDVEGKTLTYPPLGVVVDYTQSKLLPDFADDATLAAQCAFDMIWALWATGLDKSGTMTAERLKLLQSWDTGIN